MSGRGLHQLFYLPVPQTTVKVNSPGCTRAVPIHPKGGKIHEFLFLLKKTLISGVSLSPFNPMVGWKRFATPSASHFSFVSSAPGNSIRGTSFLGDIF